MQAYKVQKGLCQMIYLVHSEIPLDDFDLVQSSLERRVVPGGGDEFEFVLCFGFPLDDEFPVKAGEPALVLLGGRKCVRTLCSLKSARISFPLNYSSESLSIGRKV